MPLVTVYIPTRNRLELLLRAIQSCLAQSFADFEIIVVDDASDQSIRGQIAAIADLDPRIKVMQLDVPQGACAARNLAISHATGKYLTGLDDDDEFMPQRLQQLLDSRYQQFGAVWHIDCHSMKSRGNAMNIDAGTNRADIVVGNRDGASADSRFTALIVDSFKALGYSVSLNYPYKGGYLTQCFAKPLQQRHSVQIEINRQLYMDEAAFRPNQGFAQLQQHLMQISATLADFVMAELAGKKGNQDV